MFGRILSKEFLPLGRILAHYNTSKPYSLFLGLKDADTLNEDIDRNIKLLR